MAGGNLQGYDITGTLSNSLGGAMGGPTQQQQAIEGMQGFDQGQAFQREGGGNYSDAYKQNFVNDARSAMDTSLQSLDARAAVAGMGGGSAYGNAMARGHQDINSNMQKNLANVGYQDYNNRQNMNFQEHTNRRNMGFQDNARLQGMQQQAGAGADQNLLQQQGMLSGLAGQQNQYQQQALAQSGAMNQLGQGQYQNAMMPVNAYGQMMQSIGAPTVLSDSENDSWQYSRQGGL